MTDSAATASITNRWLVDGKRVTGNPALDAQAEKVKGKIMKTETFKASVGSAYGEKLPKEITFTYTVEQFENYPELETAKEIPSNADIVDFVNVRRKNNERAKQMALALEAAGYSKPDPNDPIVAAQTMIRNVEKMENMKPEQKQMMVAVLKQQIADEQAKRDAAKAAASTETVSA